MKCSESALFCITCLLHEVAGLVDVTVALLLQLLDDLALLLGLLAVAADLVLQGLLVLLQELHEVLLFLSGLRGFDGVLLNGIMHTDTGA